MPRRQVRSSSSDVSVRSFPSTQLDLEQIENELTLLNAGDRGRPIYQSSLAGTPAPDSRGAGLTEGTNSNHSDRRTDLSLPSTSKDANENAANAWNKGIINSSNNKPCPSRERNRSRNKRGLDTKLFNRKGQSRGKRRRSRSNSSRCRRSRDRRSNRRSRSLISASRTPSRHSIIISHSSRYRITPVPSASRSQVSRCSESRSRSAGRSSRSTVRSQVSWQDTRAGHTFSHHRPSPNRGVTDHDKGSSSRHGFRASSSLCSRCGHHWRRTPSCHCNKPVGQSRSSLDQGNSHNAGRRSYSRGRAARNSNSREDARPKGGKSSFVCILM